MGYSGLIGSVALRVARLLWSAGNGARYEGRFKGPVAGGEGVVSGTAGRLLAPGLGDTKDAPTGLLGPVIAAMRPQNRACFDLSDSLSRQFGELEAYPGPVPHSPYEFVLVRGPRELTPDGESGDLVADFLNGEIMLFRDPQTAIALYQLLTRRF
jgi:hypothetical protein